MAEKVKPLDIKCPQCKAPAGWACSSHGGTPRPPHRVRMIEAIKIVKARNESYLNDPKCAECFLRDLPSMACVYCEDHKAFRPRPTKEEK